MLAPDKCRITHIETGFDFLGQHLRRHDKKLLVTPARKNINAFLRKVRALIRANCTAPQADLIYALNRVILGWCMYHRHIVATRTFRKVDHVLWHALLRWAKRRHHKKNADRRLHRCWHPVDGRSWRSAADTGECDEQGRVVWLKLVCANKTLIRRHLKIRADANPYDPAWSAYFAERATARRAVRSRRQSLPLLS
jgi:RNA-directed DNA polymerase